MFCITRLFSKSAKKQVETLKNKGADLVILISHLGILSPEKNWRSYAVRDNVPGIDLIIDAHSHNVLPDFKQSEGKAVMTSAGISGQNLGIVYIKIQNVNKEINLRNLNFADFKDVPQNEKVDEIIKNETEKIKPILEKKSDTQIFI